MDISSLEAFIAVAQSGSFSRASEQLNLTQPAVSKRVAGLESELGVQLFNRIARQISLTEAGKQLLPKASELLEQANELTLTMSNLSNEVRGNLSIAIAHHIGLHRMPPFLRRFHQLYPQVQLDIHFEDSDQAYLELVKGDIEFAIITLPQTLPEHLSQRVLWKDKLYPVAGRESVLASWDNVDVMGLATFPCVLPSTDTETHQILKRTFDSYGLELDVQMTTNNLETLKMLAVAGIGWSMLPETMLDDSLVVIDIDQPLYRELGVVFHTKRSFSNAGSALLQLLEEPEQFNANANRLSAAHLL